MLPNFPGPEGLNAKKAKSDIDVAGQHTPRNDLGFRGKYSRNWAFPSNSPRAVLRGSSGDETAHQKFPSAGPGSRFRPR